ncbi:hypothetical protein MIZ03_3433 [Rhodoferax lithotrophicus]|jgi:hypothetical protein|uniref:Uncharacterized protein n=1 Tax=Rhodoferax lithotrophicus TaxID=2798804 RepID=A0ABN6D944_9BURK|nr:hypothetical protein [Rhodoferax sp. MIZ03]BCO28527.1 hypothetical protein MIZ03_3433 [Rhodoferax sp. MIZ03]
MGLLALFNHLINFLAPVLWLALLLPLLSLFLFKKKPVALTYKAQVALHFVVLLVALLVGLVLFGRDGKMLTYLALVLLSASSQWVMVKGWKG